MLQSSIAQQSISGSRDFHARWHSFAAAFLASPHGQRLSRALASAIAQGDAKEGGEGDDKAEAGVDADVEEWDGPDTLPSADTVRLWRRQRLLAAYAAALRFARERGPERERHGVDIPWYFPEAVAPLLAPPTHAAARSIALLLMHAVVVLAITLLLAIVLMLVVCGRQTL
jgi:hypothetical protein